MASLDAINFVSLIKNITDTSNQPNTMIYGKVVSVDPLEIDIGNNITLTKEFLFLGQMCRPHKVTIPHTHIIDTHFTEKSPSIGSVGAGLTGMVYEQAQAAAAKATMNSYTTLDDDGNEVQNQISD
jgi:hypothetical protein